jgi:hypothetical protein
MPRLGSGIGRFYLDPLRWPLRMSSRNLNSGIRASQAIFTEPTVVIQDSEPSGSWR